MEGNNENKVKFKSYRDIAEAMGVSEWTVWKEMDRIRLRFESYKKLLFYFTDRSFNLENILIHL